MDCEKNNHPILDVNGVIENGRQFDLDIILPDDDKGVVFGIVRDCHRHPMQDAVVKLIEVNFYYS